MFTQPPWYDIILHQGVYFTFIYRFDKTHLETAYDDQALYKLKSIGYQGTEMNGNCKHQLQCAGNNMVGSAKTALEKIIVI